MAEKGKMSNLLASLWLLLSANFTQVGDGNTDFNIHIATLKPQVMYASYYYHGNDNNEITNKVFALHQNPLNWLELNERYLGINNTNIVYLDARYCFFEGWKKISVGAAQQWYNNIPSTKLVLGKNYYFNTRKDTPQNNWEEALNIISSLTLPMMIEFSADMLTEDFKNYDTEIRANFTIQILANVGLYTMAEVRNYKQTDTILTFGLKLNL